MDKGRPERQRRKSRRSAIIITPTENCVTDNRRQDLLATAARERSAAGVSGPAIEWRSLATRVAALVALCLGLRG